MSIQLFVGNLSWNTNQTLLQSTFEKFGEITAAKIVTDQNTGRSRGFGFVTFKDPGNAKMAITQLDGTQLDGRTIRVNEAHTRNRGRPRRPFYRREREEQ